MNVRPAGREACNCASPYNSILERLDAMEAEILAVQATANSAMGVANAQAGAAASSASAAAASATAAGNAAISAAADASDALTQATASAGSADDAADSAADALTALQTIEGTIASVLASDIGGKVDKLTTAGFYLYMHNGSTQGEAQPVVAPTAATIPIRDSDGRMQAADPASGATDKTLVTANWVSQTGAGAPNNLLHRSGNEEKTGVLRLSSAGAGEFITTANYNSIMLGSTSLYNRIFSRSYVAGDPTKYDEHFRIGSEYVTTTSNRVTFRVSAPRTNKGDTSETQRQVSITLRCDTDGTASVVLSAKRGDGTDVSKTLGTFDGTSWS